MDSFISLANRAGEILLSWAVPMLLQSSLLVLFLFLLDGFLKKRVRAWVRYTLWLLLLLKLLLPPALTLPTGIGTLLPIPEKSLPSPAPAALRERTEPETPAPLPSPALDLDLSSPSTARRAPTASAPPLTAGTRETLALEGILFLGWAGGVLLLGLMLLANLRKAARLLRSARPAPRRLRELARASASQVGLRRPFPLLLSGKASSPFATGLFRPKVILPANPVLEISPETLRTVLLHEALHIKRWDLLVNFLQALLQVLYFFHPLLWFANKSIRRTREEAVDESVLYFAEKEKDMYLQSLLALAGKGKRNLLPSQALLGILERESHLASRVRRILELSAPARPGGGPRAWALFAALGAFLLPMARPQGPTPGAPPLRGPEKGAPQKGKASKTSNPPEEKLPLHWARRALEMGLNWLARHQDKNGKWSGAHFDIHCKGPKCSGPGVPVHDVGLTGLAVLAFLGDGNTPVRGTYRETVKKAVLWLKGIQKENGRFGERTCQSFFYSHLIATIAMTRAFGESRELSLEDPVQKAVTYISQARNPYKAWRYFPRSGDNDSSVTGWAVTALAWAKAYGMLGLKVRDADFQGPLTWYNQVTDPQTGRVGYITRGSLPARPEFLKDRFPPEKSESITAEALYVRLILGLDPASHPAMRKGARLVLSKPPAWDEKAGTIDMYYWYFGTLAAREMGGDFWKLWRRKVLEALLPHQEKTGCARGSWDPAGVWGKEGGRVYSTSLALSTLEACLPSRKGRASPRGAVRVSFPPVAGTKSSRPLVLLLENAGTRKNPKLRISRVDTTPPQGGASTRESIPEKKLLPLLKKAWRGGARKLILQVRPGVPSAFLTRVLETARKAGLPGAKIYFLR